jgi:hypothetical protein
MSDRLRQRGDAIRTYRLQVVDMQNRVVLRMTRPEAVSKSTIVHRMTRPETVTKSTMVVERPDGLPIGQICQETWGVAGAAAELANTALGGVASVIAGTPFGGSSSRLNSVMEGLAKVDHVRFGLEASGQRLGAITADSTQGWNFTIRDTAGTEVGRITKTWAGWAKERFTKADNYVVQMHRVLEEPLRSLVIAAALALDIALKQGDQFNGGSSSKQRRYE